MQNKRKTVIALHESLFYVKGHKVDAVKIIVALISFLEWMSK